MSRFDDYANKYSMIRMRREDGILEMQFHTDGGPLRWSLIPHGQLEQAFLDVGRDRDNEVIILTGSGFGALQACNISVCPGNSIPAMASALPIVINNTTMDYTDPDKVYLQVTPYYNPAVLDTFIPYLLPTGVSSGSVINLYNLSPAVAGANQFTGKFYLYYETYNF